MKFPLALLLTGLMTAQFASAQPAASTPASSSPIKDQWSYSITPYVWALGIRGSLSHNNLSTGQIKLTPGDLLSDIKMAAMIVAEARSNKFGVYLDAMYGDLGKNSSAVIGRADLNANTTAKLSMFTLAPSFNLYSSKTSYVDGLIGARYLGSMQALRFLIQRSAYRSSRPAHKISLPRLLDSRADGIWVNQTTSSLFMSMLAVGKVQALPAKHIWELVAHTTGVMCHLLLKTSTTSLSLTIQMLT